MSCIHCLEHVQSFTATRLTHDYPIRAHAKGIDDQLTDGDLASALDVWGSVHGVNYLIILKLQFYNAFDRDYKFV